MVQLTREQRTYITKQKAWMLLQSFTKLVLGIKECSNPLTDKFAYFNYNGARMWFRPAILIWSVFDHFMLLGYKKSIIGK